MNKFDKNVTSQMKAIALLLMLVHHLWMPHELAHYGAISYAGILSQMSAFGKICVGIFMFLSGYGLMASAEIRGGYCIADRLKKILPPFWLIVILAAPYLLVMGYVGIDDVVTDALLITHQLNGSWWFMQTYVIFVVSFPMFRKSLDARWCWMILLLGALTFFQPLAVFLRPYNENVHYIFFYFPLFYSGMVVQRFSVIEKVGGKHWIVKMALWIAVLGMRFVLGLHIMNVGIIMMMVVLLMDLQTFLTDRIKKLFGFLGLMSMNMWLVHQFFIDYGWHSSNPFLDLGVLYLESLGISFVLAKVYERIVGLVNFK